MEGHRLSFLTDVSMMMMKKKEKQQTILRFDGW